VSLVSIGGLILMKSAACLSPKLAGGRFSCVSPSPYANCAMVNVWAKNKTVRIGMENFLKLTIFNEIPPYLIIKKISAVEFMS
jgi:hypothetical protein